LPPAQTAEAQLTTTRANYRRIIGIEPQNLAPGSPVDRYLPPTQQGGIELSLIENPNVTAAMYGIDVSFLQVKINEGALLPTVTFQTAVQQSYEQRTTLDVLNAQQALVNARISLSTRSMPASARLTR
jgi:outer membrane protein